MKRCNWNVSLLASLLSIGACANDEGRTNEHPVVGDWESVGETTEHWARMTIEPDLDGEAVFDAYFDDELVRLEFDIEVVQSGNEWEFEMTCEECSAYDFLMECKVADGLLSCEGDGRWSDYQLEWTRE